MAVTVGHYTGQSATFGEADLVLAEWIRWGGGVVAKHFRDPYSVGGGVVSSRHFPGSIFCDVPELFPLTTHNI